MGSIYSVGWIRLKEKRDKLIMEQTNYTSCIHRVALVLIGPSHTLTCCLCMIRSRFEAGKKQLRVWLQYVCGVTEMLLSPSFGVPLVLLLSPYGDSEMALKTREYMSVDIWTYFELAYSFRND